MSLATFQWTDRVRPVVELGIGDTRMTVGQAVWNVSRWDNPSATWAGTEPTWLDITCDTLSASCTYGRQRTTDRFVPGTANILVTNVNGWADPNATTAPGILGVRPGRAVRIGVVHSVYGYRCLFRGFVDVVTPNYDPDEIDLVSLDCVDALGEVNRVKLTPNHDAIAAGDTITQRIGRILDRAEWAPTKRDLWPTADTVIADTMGGQVADLLGQAADSGGGSVFGDLEARIAYRPRDWQTYPPGTPVDGTIGNVDPGDICPTSWERPFDRADIVTRVIIGRDFETAQTLDDDPAQLLYGIEPFERTDLLTESDTRITMLGQRLLRTRGAATAPRVRSVSFDGRTADNVIDLMTTVNVYKPTRYRCRLRYPRGTVFDAEHFATGVSHTITPAAWTLDLNLDIAAPYAAAGGRWDQARWNQAVWTNAVALRADAVALLEEINA